MTVVDMGVHTGNQPTLQQTVVHWYHWVYGVFAGANTTTSFVDVSNYLLLLGSLVGIGKPHWPANTPDHYVLHGPHFCNMLLQRPHTGLLGNLFSCPDGWMKFPKSLAPRSQAHSSSSSAPKTTPVPGPVLQTRGEPKDKKQARVAKDRLSKLTDTAPGFLRKAKIRKSSTRTLYGDAWATFLAFCLQTGALCSDKSKFATMSQLDRALESFGESLYLQGKPKYTFDCAIQNCNVEYPAWPTNARLNYPLAKAAKRGWGTLEPGSSREPCPLEVAFWIASDLLARNLLSIAAAVVLCFDTYIRPGKLLELRHCNVISPARGLSRQYIQWTLLLHQEAQDPSKTGQHNDSLIVGSFEREWIGTLLGHLYKRHSKGVQAFLFDFDLSTFEKEFKHSVNNLGIQKLKLSPHCLRHGGASHDYFIGSRSLADIQQRGCWATFDSVRRYSKHGRLSKQLGLLTPLQLQNAKQASLELPRKLLRSFT